MRKIYISAIVFFVVVFSSQAQALLIDRGGGMIYSTDMDITWLQDANYARTSGYDSDGMMTWEDAMTWANDLTFGGYDDWRLPTFNGDYPDARTNPTLEHEMGYLNYVELGNPPNAGGNPVNSGPFVNFERGIEYLWYWSSTEDGQDDVWRFCFECG